MCAFEDLCGRAGIGPGDLGKIVVGAGPGSFTGLRISYAFAKGLCLSLKIPLLTISSFAAAAAGCAASGALINVVGDARRNEVFFGAYFSPEGDSVALQGPEEILPADDLAHRIGELCEILDVKQSIVVSPDRQSLPEKIKEEFPINSVKELAAGLCLLGEPLNPAFSMEKLISAIPNYIRRPAARTVAERKAEYGK